MMNQEAESASRTSFHNALPLPKLYCSSALIGAVFNATVLLEVWYKVFYKKEFFVAQAGKLVVENGWKTLYNIKLPNLSTFFVALLN